MGDVVDRTAGRGILFVSHDATRSGAPIVLLHFLRWFKKNSNRPFAVLLQSGGELVGDFEELADTWSIDRSIWCRGGLRTGLLAAAGLGAWAQHAETRDARKFSARCSPALVYFNSVASAHVIEVLAPQVPVLTHVHELESYIRVQPSGALLRLLTQTERFITCSNATRENLVKNHGVAEERVETVYESIPLGQTRAERTRQQVFQELHLPDEALLVVGSGFGQWRKGTDLFLQLARMVSQRHSNAYFAWIGGSARDVLEIEHDVHLAGLAENVRLTGAVPKSADYFAAADVFVLTSREDPYPLVCLEAAALAKPIVCFAGAGGMPEFVEQDCGFVVPYLDLRAMADCIVSLLDSPESRTTLGAAARRKVAERHDINRTAPRILEIMERTLRAGEATR